jgi:hypothetical protein
MDSDAIPVAVASIIALVLLILYAVAKLRERGRDPHWSAEVYLCYDPSIPEPDVAKITVTYNAKVATTQQVEVYLVAGGSAHGYGYAVGGAAARVVVGAVPTGLGGLTTAAWPGATPPSPVGVWLYGAKPSRGTRGVVPFNCAHWFQPA